MFSNHPSGYLLDPSRQYFVLPVDRKFLPTTKVTPHYIYLANGRKVYFESSPENALLDDETWLRKQVEGGNAIPARFVFSS